MLSFTLLGGQGDGGETTFDDRGCHLKFRFGIQLDSMGANNPPMGLAFDGRGNQEGEGGETWGELYSTPQNKELKEGGGWGGGGDQNHSFTFLLHFYFRHWKRKRKKSAKKGRERLSWDNYQVQREELVGGNDREVNCGAAERRGAGGERGLFVSETASRPTGYKNRKVITGEKKAKCRVSQGVTTFHSCAH